MIPDTIDRRYEKDQPGRVLKCRGDDSEPMWFAETKTQLLMAFLRLFEFNDSCGYYGDLEPDTAAAREVANLEKQVAALRSSPLLEKQLRDTEKELRLARTALPKPEQMQWYEAAKHGNVYAAFHLCSARQDYEYEGFEMTHVENPLEREHA